MTVATAGRAVFFSGLTVLLGLLGLVLFEFMILRSVGIAGAIVVGLAVASALTLLPALLDDRRHADRPRSPSAGSRADARHRRPVGAARPAGDAPPGRGPRPDARAPAPPRRRRSCTSGSTPRTRRSCRPSVPSRAAFDRLAGEFGEGEFAPLVARDPDDRRRRPSPANLAALYDYSRRLAADPRVSRVDSLVDVDPRLTLAQYQLLYGDPNGPRDRFVADGPRRRRRRAT